MNNSLVKMAHSIIQTNNRNSANLAKMMNMTYKSLKRSEMPRTARREVKRARTDSKIVDLREKHGKIESHGICKG